MGFPADQRERLLAVKGVGAKVVERLEQLGYSSLDELARASVEDITAQVAALLGSTCWRNSPQARASIAGAIDAARAQSPKTSSRKPSIIR